MFYKNLNFNSVLKTNQTIQNSPTRFFSSISFLVKFWLEMNSICEMIAILGKGFISCLKSSNNQNLQLLSFQKMYTLLGVLWNMRPWNSDYAKLPFGVY